MNTYTVECRDGSSGIVRGTFIIVAPNAEDACDRVRELGLTPVAVTPDDRPRPGPDAAPRTPL
jgi:hypothetical protein